VNRLKFPARAVLFDWDGTLLNSYEADVRAYLTMFRAIGIAWDAADLARHYSPNWYRVYRAARLPRAKWKEADRLWTIAYGIENPKLLPGARRVVQMLGRDFVLGIVTSGDRTRVRRQVRDFQLTAYFSACVCSQDTLKKKPHPAPLELALRRLRAHPDECIFVGDAPEDVEMARRAGVRSIGVLGPFSTAKRIRAARPNALLPSIRDLPRYLRVPANSRD
jgi:phosphoglycolate phosphatase